LKIGQQGLTFSNFFYYLGSRIRQLVITIFDLVLLTTTIYVITKQLHELTYIIFKEERINLNVTTILQFLAICFMIGYIYLTLDLSITNYPFSIKLIAYTMTLCHNISVYLLKHSNYYLKYNFYMFLSTFLYYFYLKTYPYSNVTLTNIVYGSFTAYQLTHNLFKFSF
jgi:hypothetical protein